MSKQYNQGVAESNRKRAKHGQAGGEGKPSKAYLAWRGMRSRCLNPNSTHYHRYGGRGITVCKEWANSFEAFFADVGEPPVGAWLDRIDNDKGYTKGNVRWATVQEQANNKSTNIFVRFGGKRQTLANWARELGVSYQLLMNRWIKGERGAVLLRPQVHTKNSLVTYRGKSMTLREWEKYSGVKYQTLWYRNKNNLPLF
jgi:hypothetical protein